MKFLSWETANSITLFIDMMMSSAGKGRARFASRAAWFTATLSASVVVARGGFLYFLHGVFHRFAHAPFSIRFSYR
jgi:hypothetical protein